MEMRMGGLMEVLEEKRLCHKMVLLLALTLGMWLEKSCDVDGDDMLGVICMR